MRRRMVLATYPNALPRMGRTLARLAFLFGLAPGGACRAAFLTVGAVGSYSTVSALPVLIAEPLAVCSLWRYP